MSPGSDQPPPIAFWPASHVAVKLPPDPGSTDHVPVLIANRPAAELAGPGDFAASDTTCATVFPPTFFALSARSARFASGTAAVTTAPAVPLRATNSAIVAMTRAGLGRLIFRRFISEPSFLRRQAARAGYGEGGSTTALKKRSSP